MAIRLVAPEGVMYLINDTEPGQEDLKALAVRRKDLPPLKNIYQMLGWTPSPRDTRRERAVNWQLLEDLHWAEYDGTHIPLVGSAKNALDVFNKACGTSHLLDSRFRNLLSGYRAFDGGWLRTKNAPDAAYSLADGGSLVGLPANSRARSRATARAAIAAMDPTPMWAGGPPTIVADQHAAAQQAGLSMLGGPAQTKAA